MFIRQLEERNPQFLEATVNYYKNGKISANSYVLDLDMIEHNARMIANKAKELDLQVYAMTKQIGRNPEIAKCIAKAGIEKFVAVDPWEAMVLAQADIKLGHVGHLVQIPGSMIEDILKHRPEVVTVFSYEKAKEIDEVAGKLNLIQDILLKVTSPEDMIYDGQQGGIEEKDWLDTTNKILKLKNIKIVGLTAFPCFLYNEKEKTVNATANLQTVMRAKKVLEEKFSLKLNHINTPSANSTSSLELVKKMGGTHVEPGHALTGTTPWHAETALPEKPAILYVTEVSHLYQGKAYTFFGGHYRRSHLEKVLVYSKDGIKKGEYSAITMPPEGIDYYGAFLPDDKVAVGDICIYSFRTQIFTTRSQVVLLKGVSEAKPQIYGIYDSLGRSMNLE